MKKTALLFFILLITIYANAQMLNFSFEPDILRISKLNYGQPIELVARVSGVKLSEARNLSLSMKIAETNQIKYFTQLSHDTFVLNTKMPENRMLKEIFLTFELRGNIGVDVLVTKTHSIRLTDELLVTLIEPSSGTALLNAPIKTIKAKVTYINTAPLDKKKLLAKLIIDGNETVVTLMKEGNLYVAELSKPIPVGEHKVILSLFGSFRGSDSTETKPNPFMFVLSMVAVIVVVVAFAMFGLPWVIGYMRKEAERKAKKKAEEVEAEEGPGEEIRELEEVKITAPGAETQTLKPKEKKPHIEEFIVEKPKKVEEIAMEEKREGEIVSIGHEEPKYEIVVPKETPSYKLSEEKPLEKPEEKEEKGEEKKKKGLLPFILPKEDEE